MQSQSQQLKSFWEQQMQEVKEVPADTSVFKNHQLPLARIKKVCMRRTHTTGAWPGAWQLTLSCPPLDHEIRRGRSYDKCRGTCIIRKGEREEEEEEEEQKSSSFPHCCHSLCLLFYVHHRPLFCHARPVSYSYWS